MSEFKKIVTVAMTGASGLRYGMRLLQCLIEQQCQVYVLISPAAQAVAAVEEDYTLSANTAKLQQWLSERYQAKLGQIRVFGAQEWTAPIASGSALVDAMVVCPCSSGTLAGIATGASNNLIERAADVMLKERRPLIVVPRETPLSQLHLTNMLTLSQQQVIILPASPGFYHQPKTIDDLIDFVVARILQHLNLPQRLVPPWG